MRYIALILSVVILALSCLPCADADASHMKEHQEISASHEQDAGHIDTCSPFCLCTCCAALSIHPPLIRVALVIPEHAIHYTSRYIAAFNEVSLPVWQPPRLS